MSTLGTPPWGAGGNAPSNPYLTRAWPHALETVRLEKSPCALAHGAFFSLTGPRKRLYGSGRPMAEARSIPGLWGRFRRQDEFQEMRGPGRVRSTRQGRARSFIFKILRRIYVGHLARTLTKSPLRACPQKRGGDRPFSWPVTPPCPALPSSLKKLQGQHSGKGGCPHGAVPAGRSRASRGWRHGGLVYLLAEP